MQSSRAPEIESQLQAKVGEIGFAEVICFSRFQIVRYLRHSESLAGRFGSGPTLRFSALRLRLRITYESQICGYSRVVNEITLTSSNNTQGSSGSPEVV